jgi:MarR family transcriptional regulator, transcriptional regulator for hemolysin
MPTDLDTDFLVLLYDVARQMRTSADQIARDEGMTRAQWIILCRLQRQPSLSQNELAAIAEHAPITVARLVDRLEALGLVERCADPEDRRIWRLRLTPAAAPVVRDINRYRAELRGIMTKGIDPAVLKAMLIGLRQMKENLSGSRRGLESSEAGRADRRPERRESRRSAGVQATHARRRGAKA